MNFSNGRYLKESINSALSQMVGTTDNLSVLLPKLTKSIDNPILIFVRKVKSGELDGISDYEYEKYLAVVEFLNTFIWNNQSQLSRIELCMNIEDAIVSFFDSMKKPTNNPCDDSGDYDELDNWLFDDEDNWTKHIEEC